MSDIPSGVVMVCADGSGREVATVHDFDLGGYVGFTLQRSQEIRCKGRLAKAVIDAYANPIIATALGDYHCGGLLDRLIADHGYRVHTIFIPEELQDEGAA